MNKADYLKLLSNPYVKAGLDTIARSEGVKHGYNTLYGNTRFNDLSKHPNLKITKWNITSTAAGRYQFLYRTWFDIKSKLGLNDFSPQSQDIAALYLINQAGGLQPLIKGDIVATVGKIKKIWASLPGAGYGQGERTIATIKKWFNEFAGGVANVASNNTTAIVILFCLFGAAYLSSRS